MPALILMYHNISNRLETIPADHRPYVLEPHVFHNQMKSVADSRLEPLTVAEWCSNSQSKRGLILTFDDGHISNHSAALPVLREFGLKATFFITAGAIGIGGTMNWAQIRDLHHAGMEIGSHTLTHRPPSMLSDTELEYELSESRRILENGLGAPVTSISSPTGFFNPHMRRIAEKVGYRALCISRVGFAADGGDLFSLNRVAIKRSTSEKRFQALLDFDRLTIGHMRARQRIRELARETLGRKGYLRVRRLLLASNIFTR